MAGYSPWGHRESDTSEVNQHVQVLVMSLGILFVAWMRDLVLQPGIDPRSLALVMQSLTPLDHPGNPWFCLLAQYS